MAGSRNNMSKVRNFLRRCYTFLFRLALSVDNVLLEEDYESQVRIFVINLTLFQITYSMGLPF